MFYRIMFWLLFIFISIGSAMKLLMSDDGMDFLKLIVISFACGFIIARIVTGLIRVALHSIQWIFNINDYRSNPSTHHRRF